MSSIDKINKYLNSKKLLNEDKGDVESYTDYKKLTNNFNYKGTKIIKADIEQEGNDFDGFRANIECELSNGCHVEYYHDIKGKGKCIITTEKGTKLIDEHFDLQKIGGGYGEILIAFIKQFLDFNF